ncbi:MAG: hypothetical protein ACT4OY_02360 [Alphaproteobacteria bacterium]
MKHIFVIAIILLTLYGPPAKADNYGWCPADAVCSDTSRRRVIVYDPHGHFRQTTLMSRDVPLSKRNPNAEKYDREVVASAGDDTYIVNDVAFKREYFFRPAGGY